MSIRAGDELRNYRILVPLGQGGFGKTFLAEDLHNQPSQQYVVKEFNPASQNPEHREIAQERFLREAAVLLEIGQKHDQVPQLFSYFRHRQGFYLVQEYIRGETLSQLMMRLGQLQEAAVIQLLRQVLPILEFLHNHKIIHRDVKPDNIILRSQDGKPVLIDFGAVKESVNTVIQTGMVKSFSIIVGSPGFMAPEQAAGRPCYVSDIFSLGMTAIALLTGKAPHDFTPNYYTQELNWQEELPQLSPTLVRILEKAVHFNPRDRYQSAAEMLQALEALPPSPIDLVITPRWEPPANQEQDRQLENLQTPAWGVPDRPTREFDPPEPALPPPEFWIPPLPSPPKLSKGLRKPKRPLQIPSLWGFVAVGVTAFGSGLGGFYLWSAQQQQDNLKLAQTLKQQGRYQRCIDQLHQASIPVQVLPQVNELLGDCHFALAQEMAHRGNLTAALRQANHVPPSATVSAAARRAQEEWSEKLLQQAASLYEQGQLQQALQMAATIPETSPQRVMAQSQIQTWQIEWQRNNTAIQAARAALAAKDWQTAQAEASKVTTPYWQRQAKPLLRQANTMAAPGLPQTAGPNPVEPAPAEISTNAAQNLIAAFLGHINQREYDAAKDLLDPALASQFNGEFYQQFQRVTLTSLRIEAQTASEVTFLGEMLYTWPDGRQRQEQRTFVVAEIEGQIKIMKNTPREEQP